MIVLQNKDFSWSYDYNQSNKDFDLTCTFYANEVLGRHSIKESKWHESNQYLLNQISDNGEISDSNFIKAIALNFLFKLPLEDNKKAQLKMKKLINNLIENQQANGGFTVSSKPASNERVNLPVTSYVASALKECVFADVEKKKCQKAIESIKNLLFSAPFTNDRSLNSKGLAWVYYPNNENDVSEDSNYAQFLAIKCFEAISNDRFDFWLRSAKVKQFGDDAGFLKDYDCLYLADLWFASFGFLTEDIKEKICNDVIESMIHNLLKNGIFIQDNGKIPQYSLVLDLAFLNRFFSDYWMVKGKDSVSNNEMITRKNPKLFDYISDKKRIALKEKEEYDKNFFDASIVFIDESDKPILQTEFYLEFSELKVKSKSSLPWSITSDEAGKIILKDIPECNLKIKSTSDRYIVKDLIITPTKELRTIKLLSTKTFYFQIENQELVDFKDFAVMVKGFGYDQFNEVGIVTKFENSGKIQLGDYYPNGFWLKIITPNFGEGVSQLIKYEEYKNEKISIPVNKMELITIHFKDMKKDYLGKAYIKIYFDKYANASPRNCQNYTLNENSNGKICFYKRASDFVYIAVEAEGYCKSGQEFNIVKKNEFEFHLLKGGKLTIKMDATNAKSNYTLQLTKMDFSNDLIEPKNDLTFMINGNSEYTFYRIPPGAYKLDYFYENLMNRENALHCYFEKGLKSIKIKEGAAQEVFITIPKLYQIQIIESHDSEDKQTKKSYIHKIVLFDQHKLRRIPVSFEKNKKGDTTMFILNKGSFIASIYFFDGKSEYSEEYPIELSELNQKLYIRKQPEPIKLNIISEQAQQGELLNSFVYILKENSLRDFLNSIHYVPPLFLRSKGYFGSDSIRISPVEKVDLVIFSFNIKNIGSYAKYLPLYFENIDFEDLKSKSLLTTIGEIKSINIRKDNEPCAGAYYSLTDKESGFPVLNVLFSIMNFSDREGKIEIAIDTKKEYVLHISYMDGYFAKVQFKGDAIPKEINLTKGNHFKVLLKNDMVLNSTFKLLNEMQEEVFYHPSPQEIRKRNYFGLRGDLIHSSRLIFDGLEKGKYFVEIFTPSTSKKSILGPFEAK